LELERVNSALQGYGKASTITKYLKLPACMILDVKLTSTLAPVASGEARLIVPTEKVLLNPPPAA